MSAITCNISGANAPMFDLVLEGIKTSRLVAEAKQVLGGSTKSRGEGKEGTNS